MSLRARTPAALRSQMADKDDKGPDPKTADAQIVQLGLNSALAAAVGVALAMCVLAALVSLVIIWLVPPPGTRDLPTEMPWVRFSAFDPSHGEARPPAACFAAPPAQTDRTCAPPRLRERHLPHRLHGAAQR